LHVFRQISPLNDSGRRLGYLSNTMSDSPLLGHSSFETRTTGCFSTKEMRDFKVNKTGVIKYNPREALKRRNSTGTILERQ
jgi:hypothetical protein